MWEENRQILATWMTNALSIIHLIIVSSLSRSFRRSKKQNPVTSDTWEFQYRFVKNMLRKGAWIITAVWTESFINDIVQKHTMVADFKPKIGRKPTDTEDSVSLWEHCVKGFNNHSYQKPQSKSKNKLDLRSHLNPYEAVDVYKIQSGQSFQLGPKKKDPFDISKVNFEERL